MKTVAGIDMGTQSMKVVLYDYENKKDLDYIWSGWLNTNDLEQLMSL